MSKEEQMNKMTVAEINKDPCLYCCFCDWKKDPKCYEGSIKQCTTCSIILSVIDKCREEHLNDQHN